jgi:hypothetical protein
MPNDVPTNDSFQIASDLRGKRVKETFLLSGENEKPFRLGRLIFKMVRSGTDFVLLHFPVKCGQSNIHQPCSFSFVSFCVR